MTVHGFPSAHHVTMVDVIARGMAACASIDAAQEYLVDHLDIHCARLGQFGVCDDELENECRQFAIVAWDAFQKLRRETDVA